MHCIAPARVCSGAECVVCLSVLRPSEASCRMCGMPASVAVPVHAVLCGVCTPITGPRVLIITCLFWNQALCCNGLQRQGLKRNTGPSTTIGLTDEGSTHDQFRQTYLALCAYQQPCPHPEHVEDSAQAQGHSASGVLNICHPPCMKAASPYTGLETPNALLGGLCDSPGFPALPPTVSVVKWCSPVSNA